MEPTGAIETSLMQFLFFLVGSFPEKTVSSAQTKAEEVQPHWDNSLSH